MKNGTGFADAYPVPPADPVERRTLKFTIGLMRNSVNIIETISQQL